jgi:hypothetical protein
MRTQSAAPRLAPGAAACSTGISAKNTASKAAAAIRSIVKRAIVAAGCRGLLTPPVATFLISGLGLRHD